MKKLIIIALLLITFSIYAQTKSYKGGIYTFFEGRYDLTYKIKY